MKTCEVCGKVCSRFANHLRVHKLTVEEYYLKYICKSLDRPHCKLTNCDNKVLFRGMTRGFQTYCSNSCKNKSHWLKQDHRDYMLKINQLRIKDLWSRDAFRLHKSNEMKQNWKDLEFSHKVKSATSAAAKRTWNNPIIRKSITDKLSLQSTRQNADPNCNWGLRYGKRHHKYGCVFKSGYELQFVDNLIERHILWKYEYKTFLLSNGHRYTPDFYLPEYTLYVEVKSEYFLTDSVFEKLKLLEELGESILLIKEDNWNKVLDTLVFEQLFLGGG